MEQNPTYKNLTPTANPAHEIALSADSCGIPPQKLSIGMDAPNFTAQTTFGMRSMSDYKGKWLVFFSHPADFTPVCTTEFLSFSQNYEYFQKLGADLLGLSIDSNPSHLAWVYTIYLSTGITVPFPVVADPMGTVAKLYGMLAEDVSTTQTVRNVYIICPKQKIRAILSYPMTTGRNIPEIIRILEALQLSDAEGVVTPANWLPGQMPMVPAPQTYKELLEREKNPPNLECQDWFWCYKHNDNNTALPMPRDEKKD